MEGPGDDSEQERVQAASADHQGQPKQRVSASAGIPVVMAAIHAADVSAAGTSTQGQPAARKRGRPPGSTKKRQTQAIPVAGTSTQDQPAARKRGRPPGSGRNVRAKTSLFDLAVAAAVDGAAAPDGADTNGDKTAIATCGGTSSQDKAAGRRRGRPPGSKNKMNISSPSLVPIILQVNEGEDVVHKMLSLAQELQHALVVLSAGGCFASAAICHQGNGNLAGLERQHSSAADGPLVLQLQGPLQLLSLQGSALQQGPKLKHSLTVVLLDVHGNVRGGAVAGALVAAGPLQMVVGHWDTGQDESYSTTLKTAAVSALPSVAHEQQCLGSLANGDAGTVAPAVDADDVEGGAAAEQDPPPPLTLLPSKTDFVNYEQQVELGDREIDSPQPAAGGYRCGGAEFSGGDDQAAVGTALQKPWADDGEVAVDHCWSQQPSSTVAGQHSVLPPPGEHLAGPSEHSEPLQEDVSDADCDVSDDPLDG
eukprot:gene12293-12429_t